MKNNRTITIFQSLTIVISLSLLICLFVISSFVTRSIQTFADDIQTQNAYAQIKSIEKYIITCLDDHKKVLEDYATFPFMVQSVMQPERFGEKIKDYMNQLLVLGEKHKLVLLDFSGNTIYATQGMSLIDYSKEDWVRSLIDGQKPSHLGISTIQDVVYWRVAVPVIFNNLPEGIFLVEIPMDSINPLNLADDNERITSSFGVLLTNGKKILTSFGSNIEGRSLEQKSNILGVTLKYTYVETFVKEAKNTVVKNLIGIMGMFILLTIIILLYLTRWMLVLPLKHLSTLVSEKAETEKEVELINRDQKITEVKELAERFNVMLKKVQLRRKQLIEFNKTLEMRVEERTQELAQSNTELEKFAYVASHDLQEPLRMVASYTQLLERNYQDKLDEEGKEYIYFAVDGAKRMKALIEDLLSYSRLRRDQDPFTQVACQRACESAIKNLQAMIAESQAKVTVNPLPVVWGREPQLLRLFQNIIGNGIKYRGKSTPEINISVDEKDNEYIFSVKDNGIGIEPQYQEQIFEIFQRLHLRDQYQGNGIGLAVCKKIVERHGGRIWVESKKDKGATFYFTIPKNKQGGNNK